MKTILITQMRDRRLLQEVHLEDDGFGFRECILFCFLNLVLSSLWDSYHTSGKIPISEEARRNQ